MIGVTMDSQEKEVVGEYEVVALSVGDGLDLLSMITEDPAGFQKELVLRCVRKKGESIAKEPFSKMVPVLPELLKAAMRLNGFSTAEPQV
jgi:hypothetical protein